jgi:hypothetical protein
MLPMEWAPLVSATGRHFSFQGTLDPNDLQAPQHSASGSLPIRPAADWSHGVHIEIAD